MALDVVVTFPQSAVSGFTVERYVIDDAMGELFQVELVVTSPDPALDMKTVVGEAVVVDFPSQPFLPRIQGMVRRAEQQTCEPAGLSRYALWVVPPLWLLSKRVDRRIFQQRTTTEIVGAVLAVYGGRVPAPTAFFSGLEVVREYRTQYGESDLDFLLRLLAEDGIASCFSHAIDSAWLLLDDTTRLSSAPDFQVPWRPVNLAPGAPVCLALRLAGALEFSRFSLRGHDYVRPGLAIDGVSAVAPESLYVNQADLEDYDFDVALAAGRSDADERAKFRQENATAGYLRVQAAFNMSLPVGAGVLIEDHPTAQSPLRVIRLRSEVESTAPGQTTESHELELGSQTLPFRPKMRPRPRIAGTQTARVVGAPGEAIDIDNLGRVVVEHRWDRRGLGAMGGTSRRVRVACPWAGPQRGLFGVPRVGDEVVVSYLDGDPDEPLIVGSVHDAVRTTPQHLPSEKTVTTWRSSSTPGGQGYNEVLMDDAAGAERLHLRAQRDYQTFVGNNAAHHVVGNADVKVVGSAEVRAPHVRVEASADLTTESPTWTSYSDFALIYPGNALMVDSESGMISLKACGASLVIGGGKITLDAPEGITITAAGGDVTINGAPKIKLNP